MAATLTIAGVQYIMIEDQFDQTNALSERQRLKCDVIDYTGTAHWQKGNQVVVTDPILGVIFNGYLYTDKEVPQYPSGAILHSIDCIDQHYLADKRSYTRTYDTSEPAGKIVVDMLHDVLSQEGIAQNYAQHTDNTVTDFNQGMLSSTIGITNIGDGNLELTPAGSNLTFTETTTADFASGSLTNCTATNNTLIPTSTNAIKMMADMTLAGTNSISAVTSVMIWSGSQVVSNLGSTHFEYDLFIDPASPEAKFAADILFSDGTIFNAVASIAGANEDAQFILPDASNDVSGLATSSWYHRGSQITSHDGSWSGAGGKTISAIILTCKGTRTGTYTAFFKNFALVGNTTASFSMNVNPPQQLQVYGFTSTSVSIVPAYDLYSTTSPTYRPSAYKITSPISIDQVKLLRASFIEWAAIVPDKCALVVKYSLDGTSFTACTNGAALPNLPAGLSVAGTSIYLQYEFYYLAGALPDSLIQLEEINLTIYSSYAATKTDATYSVLSQANWNAGTLTNLVANASGELTLNGIIRTWDDGSDAGQTMYASSFQAQTANNRSFTFWNIPAGSNIEVRSRFDFAGQWQNFITEVDIQLTPADPVQHGFVYRTTNWQANSGSAAYYVWITTTFIALGKGTNSSGSASTTQTIISSASATYISGSWHRLKVVVNGNNHQIYVDGILIINVNDATYTASGYMGIYTTDGGSGASSVYTTFFDNFGIAPTLSGRWLSLATSLSSVANYGNSIVTWRDKSPSYNGLTNTSALVEVTYNGGSTWTTCTNGASLPGMTSGQLLSGVNMQFRITLTTSNAASLPAIDNLVVHVLGQYSASGTRSTAPMALDTMVRANQSGLGTSTDGQTYTITGTGTPSISSNHALVVSTGSDTHASPGTRTGTDEDIYCQVNIGSTGDICGIEGRYSTASGTSAYKLLWYSGALHLNKSVSGVNTVLATSSAFSMTPGTWYVFHLRITGSTTASLQGRAWQVGALEPTTWNVTATD